MFVDITEDTNHEEFIGPMIKSKYVMLSNTDAVKSNKQGYNYA